MGTVLHLFVSVRRGLPVKEVGEVSTAAGGGLAGCAHGGRRGEREVLLMDVETLRELGLEPGQVKENVTTEGVRLADLRRGQRLRVGEAVVEVTMPCEPCGQMDAIRAGLQKALQGRRGMLCRVLKSGRIRRGDGMEVLGAVPAGPGPGTEA